jgi:ribosome assembly protein 4
MATLLPPPKRQKSAYSQSLKPKEATPPPEPIPSVVVQFKSAEDGSNLGPAINLPADTGRDALQMLVNKLRGEVSEMSHEKRGQSACHAGEAGRGGRTDED